MSNKTNIFDLILQSREADFSEIQSPPDSIMIDKSIFFTEGGVGGYISKANFLKLVTSQTELQLKEFDHFLKQLSNRVKINTNPFERTDRNGRKYVWVVIPGRRGNQEFKIFTDEKMCDFIAYYQAGQIDCSLNLEELYLEANR